MKKLILVLGLAFFSYINIQAQYLEFAPPVNYPVVIQPVEATAADFDNDDDQDLAVVNRMNNGTISILLNNGDGTFQDTLNYRAGFLTWSLFAADFDNDGYRDLAILNNCCVTILKNNGDATFQTNGDLPIGGTPFSIFAADFDGDEDNDLVVSIPGEDTIAILANNGNGTFLPPMFYNPGIDPTAICVLDFDGDSDLDIAVLVLYIGNSIAILKNNGDGIFQLDGTYFLGPPIATSIFASDLDGDGDNDIAGANDIFNGAISVIKNTGDGTFQEAIRYDCDNCEPDYITGADLDSDSDIDLLTTNYSHSNFSFFRNTGHGVFNAVIDFDTDFNINSCIATDLDNDSDQDVVTTNYSSANISILINLTYDMGSRDEYAALPKELSAYQNYPNPFNARTVIKYCLAEPTAISIDIFDISGSRIDIIQQGIMQAGEHQVTWNADDCSSGLYFCAIRAGEKTITQRMVLVK